jgi:hypothetical protein
VSTGHFSDDIFAAMARQGIEAQRAKRQDVASAFDQRAADIQQGQPVPPGGRPWAEVQAEVSGRPRSTLQPTPSALAPRERPPAPAAPSAAVSPAAPAALPQASAAARPVAAPVTPPAPMPTGPVAIGRGAPAPAPARAPPPAAQRAISAGRKAPPAPVETRPVAPPSDEARIAANNKRMAEIEAAMAAKKPRTGEDIEERAELGRQSTAKDMEAAAAKATPRDVIQDYMETVGADNYKDALKLMAQEMKDDPSLAADRVFQEARKEMKKRDKMLSRPGTPVPKEGVEVTYVKEPAEVQIGKSQLKEEGPPRPSNTNKKRPPVDVLPFKGAPKEPPDKPVATFVPEGETQAHAKVPLDKLSEPAVRAIAAERKVGSPTTPIDELKKLLRNLWKDEFGGLRIKPERPGEAAPVLTPEEARGMFRSLKSKLFDYLPGLDIANTFAALTRGNHSWGLKALDELTARNPKLELDKKPGVIEARRILEERAAKEPPAEPAAEVKVPDVREPVPRERTVDKSAAPPLPELPTHTIMQQVDAKGNVIREAPFDLAAMDRWREQLPNDHVRLKETNVTRPSEPRHEGDEVPVKAAREKTVEPGAEPAPGVRTPQKVIDPITGEARETKIWRDEPAPPAAEVTAPVTDTQAEIARLKAENAELRNTDITKGPVDIGRTSSGKTADITPEKFASWEMDKINKAKSLLSPEQAASLDAKIDTLPKSELMAGVDAILERLGRKERAGTLSNGAPTNSAAEFAHKQGVLDANEAAYNAHPPVDGETAGQTRERAKRIVETANKNINDMLAQLKADTRFKGTKAAAEFDGKYEKMANKPAGTLMVQYARRLTSGKIGTDAFLRDEAAIKSEGGAKEVHAERKAQADVELRKTPTAGEAELRAGDNVLTAGLEKERGAGAYTGRPDYEPSTPEHGTLTDWLNNLSDKDHDLLQAKWDHPLDSEVVNSKDPSGTKFELGMALAEAKAEARPMRFDLPSLGQRIKTGLEDLVGKFRGGEYFAPTKVGGKASEPKVIPPETIEGKRIAKEALDRIDAEKKASESWVAELRKASEHFLKSEKGGLDTAKVTADVTKVFDWIKKKAQDFVPDREPMVPTGMTRLYRVETKLPEGRKPFDYLADWQKQDPQMQAVINAEGRWFAADRGELDYYVNHIKESSDLPSTTKYVDVPTSVVEQYRVDNLSGAEGKAAREFSRRWDKEFFLPRDLADQRVPVDPDDVSFVDHLRRLWADESGALSTNKIARDWTDLRAKFRNPFAHNIAPETQEYMRSLGERHTVMRTKDTSLEKQDLYDAVAKMRYKDTGKTPTPEEFGVMHRAFEDSAIAKLPARQQEFWKEHIAPLIRQEQDLFKEVRDLYTKNQFPGYKDLTEVVDGKVPHIPHRLKGKLDYDPDFDVLTTKNSMNLWEQSLQPRKWLASIQDGTGKREVFHVNKDGNMVFYKDGEVTHTISANAQPAQFNPHQVGQRFGDRVVDNARIDELMKHGRNFDEATGKSSKLEYVDNPAMALSDSINGLIYAKARAKLLDDVLNNPKFSELSVTANSPSAAKAKAEEKWGKGNVATTTLPQVGLEGRRWFPKQLAWEFEDMVKQGFNYNGSQAMEALARLNQSTLKLFYFLGPQVHVFNVLDKLVIGRGYDNLNVAKTLRNSSKALRDVRNNGPMTQLYAEAGGNAMYAHSMTSRLMPNIARMLNEQIKEKPWAFDPIRKVFGIDLAPKGRRVYQISNDVMWWQSDVMGQMLFHDNLDRHGGGNKNWEKKFAEYDKLNELKNPTADQVRKRDELGKWRLDLARVAVRETEKIVDGYTIPTTFGKSVGLEYTEAGRMIQKMFADQAFTNFGRFSYGLTKTLAEIAKNMMGKNENLSTPQGMALGFSQAAMLAGMVSVVYPALTKLYSMAPWAKPESEVEHRGISSVAMIPHKFATEGAKDGWSKLAQRAWAPSTLASTAMETWANRDFGGRAIIESGSGWGEVPGQLAEYGVSKMWSPAAAVSRAAVKEGPEYAALRFIESNFGVKTPTDAMTKYKAQHDRKLAQEGRSRERHPRGVVEQAGSQLHRLVRGYEEGGLVTGAETEGVIPVSRR